jgi:signal transduction histidine kinase
VFLRRDPEDDSLHIRVIDNGKGVDAAFDIVRATGLGLSIVRTLVTTELGGSITMRPASAQDREHAAFDGGGGGGGASAGSPPDEHGTVVDVRIPTDSPR